MIIDEANIKNSVLKLAIPSVAEQALVMVVGVVSTIFVGRISNEALSAVGLINTLVGFIIALFVALSTGCTVLVARLIGEEEQDKAKEAMRQSITLGASTSLLFSIVCYIFAIPIINLFFHSAEYEVIRLADTYFRISLYTFPLALISIIISGSLRGIGDTKTPMFIACIVNIINVLMNVIFIYGMNFGISGAAYAVAISRGIGGILSILALYLPKQTIHINVFSRFKLNVEIIKRILKVGIPAAMEQIVMQGGFLVLQIVISGMGTVAIAVYQLGMSINSMCFVPLWGFGIAATTLVGQGLGAKKSHLAEKSSWITLKLTLAVSVVLTLLIFIFARQLVSMYTDDKELINIGTTAIRIFSLSQPFLSIVVVISGALRGAGDITYVMITSFVGIWVFRILITIIMNSVFQMGIMGVWAALFLDFFIRSIMYLIRFKRGRWKDIVI